MAVHCYSGPSLPRNDKARFESIRFLPPVAGGDLLKARFASGDTVVIIDGIYHHSPSVRHKEILALIDHGVTVVGAASMGALRAAELHPHGMIGIGKIFGDYRDGVIDGDDEVAVLHAQREDGCEPLTFALVDLRMTVRDAVASGRLARDLGDALVSAVKRVPYMYRSDSLIYRILTHELGTGTADAARLHAELRRTWVHQKRADAIAALEAAVDGLDDRASGKLRSPFNRTVHLLDWEVEGAGEEVDGLFVSDKDVLDHLRLNDRDYPERHARVALAVAAERLQDTTEPGRAGRPEFEPGLEGRIAEALGLGPLAFDQDSCPESLGAMWMLDRPIDGTGTRFERFVARMFSSAVCDWRLHVLADYRATGDLDAVRVRVADAMAFMHGISEQNARYSKHSLPRQVMVKFYLKRWEGEDPAASRLDRGFLDDTQLGYAAEKFYLYDRYMQPLASPTTTEGVA